MISHGQRLTIVKVKETPNISMKKTDCRFQPVTDQDSVGKDLNVNESQDNRAFKLVV